MSVLSHMFRRIDKNLSKVVSVLFFRGVGTLIQVGLSLLLGRSLGATGAGVYYVYVSAVTLIGTALGAGFPIYILRHVAALEAQEDYALARKLMLKVFLLSGLIGVIGTGPLLLWRDALTAWLSDGGTIGSIGLVVAVSSVLWILVRVLTQGKIGQGKAEYGMFLQVSFAPLVLLLVLGLAKLFRVEIGVSTVLLVHLLALALAGAWAFYTWFWPPTRGDRQWRLSETRVNRKSVSALWGSDLLAAASGQVPILILPLFANAAQIGQYTVGQRVVYIAATAMAGLASVFSPRFAGHFAQKDVLKLRRDLRSTQIYSVLIYVPFLMVVIPLGDRVMAVFGDGFVGGHIYLWVLAAGQLVNSATGLVTHFQNMTGNEGVQLAIHAVSVAILVLLCVWWGSAYGSLGVAIAVSLVTALRNVVSYVVVWRHLRTLDSEWR